MAHATTEDQTITCTPAPETMTVDQAHTVMQDHLRCAHTPCPTRRVARRTLVNAGRLVLPGCRQTTTAVRLGDFVPRTFAVCVDAAMSTQSVVAWGLTLPDGSAFTIQWCKGSPSVTSICRSAESAAWLHGGELHWLDAGEGDGQDPLDERTTRDTSPLPRG